MRNLLLLPAILAIGASGLSANDFVLLAGEIQIPLPESWSLVTDSLDFPFQLVHDEEAAEILIFRAEISADEAVTDEIALKKSVDNIIDDVILSLPQAKLLTSSGFYETHRTGFVLEFVSLDTISQTPLWHRLEGVLYRHPDNHQILYTIWGKTTMQEYDDISGAISLVQDGFVYKGKHENEVFAPRQQSYWLLFLVMMIVVGLFFYFRPKSRSEHLPTSSRVSHFWRCECGRLNHRDSITCRRCGRKQTDCAAT